MIIGKKIGYKIGLILVITLTACSNHSSKKLQGYIEGRYSYLASQFAGRLEKLAVKRGDFVKQNSLLFKLEPEPEATELKKAENQLQQANQLLIDQLKGKRPEFLAALIAQREQVAAQLNLDRKTLRRYRTLFKQGAIDKARVDAALTSYQLDKRRITEINAKLAEAKLGSRINQIMAQQATVDAAKAAVQQATWSLQQKTIYAPVAGQIFDTYYREGEFVAAGHPVVSLLAPKNVKLIFFITEPLLVKIHIGQAVKFSCDGCKKPYTAKINFISSQAEYTPPVIYSVGSRAKLVYRVEAAVATVAAQKLHVSQPVDVTFESN